MNKGFTLIEIIISLIILSIILLISSNLLKSSINYQEATNSVSYTHLRAHETDS